MSELAPHRTVQELLMLLGIPDTEQVELFLIAVRQGKKKKKKAFCHYGTKQPEALNSNLKTAFHLD